MELSRSRPQPQLDTVSPAQPAREAAAARGFWIVPPPDGAHPPAAPDPLPPDIVSDDALIAAVVAGEPEALGALYDRHARVVFSLIVRIAGDRETAEDILQEVFLRVWQQADAFDETRGTVRSWLYGIAHNLALNELRRRQRRPQVQQRAASADPDNDDLAECVDPGQQPAADAWCAVRNAGLADALALLPQPQRAVLALYATGYSQSEIAAELGEPIGTVKSRMRRALCRLREALPDLGIDPGWQRD
jgi:RNA polymerase sigma-70 factor, ECF subfamily